MPGLVVRSPGWAVSTLLHWRPITVLLNGNAVPIGLTSPDIYSLQKKLDTSCDDIKDEHSAGVCSIDKQKIVIDGAIWRMWVRGSFEINGNN